MTNKIKELSASLKDILYPKIPTHKEMDKEWSKLTARNKYDALRHIRRLIAQDKANQERQKLYKELQEKYNKGKDKNKECTCLPKEYGFGECQNCHYWSEQDRINTPG